MKWQVLSVTISVHACYSCLQLPVQISWWPSLHPPWLCHQERRSLSAASPVRVFYLVELTTWLGTSRNQDSLQNCDLLCIHSVHWGFWTFHRQWIWDRFHFHHLQCPDWRPGRVLLSASTWYSSHSTSASNKTSLRRFSPAACTTQPWTCKCPPAAWDWCVKTVAKSLKCPAKIMGSMSLMYLRMKKKL